MAKGINKTGYRDGTQWARLKQTPGDMMCLLHDGIGMAYLACMLHTQKRYILSTAKPPPHLTWDMYPHASISMRSL